MNITSNQLKEYLHYNPDTGDFIWKKLTGRRAKIGEKAGSVDAKGYIVIKIFGKIYKAHRLAWLYINNKFPENFIDHINKNRLDNRWTNLRQATNSQNSANRPKCKTNKTGCKGVRIVGNRFASQIKHNNQVYHLGCFYTLEEASNAYKEAAKKYHGEYASA